jgi:hypothetical protein
VRLGGDNRYATSALIAEWEIEEWYANKAFGDFSFRTCYVATGENYPDALVGGQLAGGFWNDTYIPAPLLLTKDGDTTAERIIDKEIDFSTGLFNTCIDENDYNTYVDAVVWSDADYMFADAWYGTKNDYFVNADALMLNATENPAFFNGSVLTIDPVTIPGGTNGGWIYRNLGVLGDDNFYGYILGGENSVSKKKAESLDQVVKDAIDIDDSISFAPTDNPLLIKFDAKEAKKFDSIFDFWMNAWDSGLFVNDYFKLEFDRTINGVDRWIVKAQYNNKWQRINGIYAYAYNYTVNGANGPLKQTDWLIMGETYSETLVNTFDWVRLMTNNNII